MFDNILPIPDAEFLPFYPLVLKLVACVYVLQCLSHRCFRYFSIRHHPILAKKPGTICNYNGLSEYTTSHPRIFAFLSAAHFSLRQVDLHCHAAGCQREIDAIQHSIL